MTPSRETQVRFYKFLFVGGLVAGVQFLSLMFLKAIFNADIAFSISFFFATVTHYAMNRFWAMPSDRKDFLKQLLEYALAVALNYFINFSFFKLCHDRIGLGVMSSAMVALPPSTIVAFAILNYRVFRRKPSKC